MHCLLHHHFTCTCSSSSSSRNQVHDHKILVYLPSSSSVSRQTLQLLLLWADFESVRLFEQCCSIWDLCTDINVVWLTASSTEHNCNEDVFARSIEMKCVQWILVRMNKRWKSYLYAWMSSIGNPFAYKFIMNVDFFFIITQSLELWRINRMNKMMKFFSKSVFLFVWKCPLG